MTLRFSKYLAADLSLFVSLSITLSVTLSPCQFASMVSDDCHQMTLPV